MVSKLEIELPGELLAELRKEAKHGGRSVDSLIRASLRIYLYNKGI
ncbi:hypothetical protein NIES2109_22750 [Nostoc sp. HK-01]|nr:hypothetical protein NIES2109_22750 [Nostoc sp. HK-01]